MTCIIGLEHEGSVYIGADSAAVDINSYAIDAIRFPKVFQTGLFLMGYTTSFRMGQLLEHNLSVRDQAKKEYDITYLVTAFIKDVRKVLSLGGFTKIDNNEESGGDFLLGFNNKLYAVFSDFHVNSYTAGLAAVGCGGEVAIGAMVALENSIKDPEERIKRALEIVASRSAGVCGPFHILKGKE